MGAAFPVEVLLLGPVEARVDGRPVRLAGAPQRVVLARLAISAGRIVSTLELIDALWPTQPPDNAVGNLHSYVSRLRRAVGEAPVTREPGGYRLVIAPEAVDIGGVELLVGRARAVAKADPADAARLLEEALSRWRGEPLADLPDPLPFAPELARWTAWRRQLVEDRLGHRIAAGHAADVLPEVEQAATADPMSERMHLLWMTALHHLGRTAEGLRTGDRFRRRLLEDSGLGPSPALADLERRLLADDAGLRVRPERPLEEGAGARPGRAEPGAPRRWAPRDRFVGRSTELGTLAAALDHHQMVTVVGPGGVGKTRLVLEFLDRLAGRWTVHVVELAEVPDGGEAAVATAATLGLRSAPAGAEAAVADRLAGEPALLVLDNCEHLLASAATLVAEICSRCPDLRILATSRRRLGVPGERVERLGPLPEADQVALFGDRASLLREGFDAGSPEVRADVAAVCRLVDGLPLAVELSASREAVFGLGQLRERLAAGMEVLDPSGAATRSTAVSTAVEWSYRLLDGRARALLDRLAVCRGGLTLDALAYFAGDIVDNPASVLAELVEASLVVADHGSGAVRFRLLDTVRHVARSHLDASGIEAARDGHARWMIDEAQRAASPHLERTPQAVVLLAEVANIRDALAWLAERGRWGDVGRLAIPTALATLVHPHLEVLAQLRRLEAAPEEAATCAVSAGAAAVLQGDYQVADRLLTLGLDRLANDDPDRWVGHYFRFVNRMFTSGPPAVEVDAAAVLDDAHTPAWPRAVAVCCAALMHLYHGDRARAEGWMVDHTRLLDDVGGSEAFVAFTRGELAAAVDPESALVWYEQAARQCQRQGQAYVLQISHIGRLAVLMRTGRPADAVDAALELLDDLRHLGMWPQIWTTLRLAAELLVALDDHMPAARLLAAADVDPLAPAVARPERARHAELWRRIGEGLDPGAVAAARDAGAGGGRASAVAHGRAALAGHV